MNFVIENDIPKAINKEEIIVATGNDRELQKLIRCVEETSIDHKDADLRKYSNVFNELAVVDGLVFRGERIVVPQTLRHLNVTRFTSSELRAVTLSNIMTNSKQKLRKGNKELKDEVAELKVKLEKVLKELSERTGECKQNVGNGGEVPSPDKTKSVEFVSDQLPLNAKTLLNILDC